MNYYTSTIPLPIAEKLKKKGMHQLSDSRMEGWLNSGDNITYAEVFDWLMNEGVYCTVTDTRAAPTYEIVGYISIVCMLRKRSKVSEVLRTWRDAANDAIEKALTLI